MCLKRMVSKQINKMVPACENAHVSVGSTTLPQFASWNFVILLLNVMEPGI